MTDCRCVGIERCGLDVECALCCGDAGDCQRDCEGAASATLEQPYFDADGNEGTYGEVMAFSRAHTDSAALGGPGTA